MLQKENIKKKDKVLKPKKQYVEKGSVEEKQHLSRLENDLLQVDGDFIKYASDVVDFKKKINKQSDHMTDYYHHMLMGACVEPLAKGLTSDAIIQSIGMYAGMCLVNKDFKAHCHQSVRESLYPDIDKKVEKYGEDSKWGRRRDQMLKDQNHGRLPLSPKAAALQHLAFGRHYYDAIREPDADVKTLTTDYQTAIDSLNEQMAYDGVDPKEMAQCQRTIVGQLIERDPMYAQHFEETGFDSIKRADGKIQVGDDGVKRSVWTGEFKKENGEPFVGTFTPRKIVTAEKHGEAFTQFVSDQIDKCETATDMYANLQDNAHRNMRSMRMSMMMMDGMDVDEMRDVVTASAGKGIKGWMDAHPEAVVKEQARRAEQTRQNEQREQQSTRNTDRHKTSPFGDAFTDFTVDVEADREFV